MARFLTIVAGLATIWAAAALYALKHDVRRLEAEMHALERGIERAESDIAGLKVERAWLGRPDRIDKLARARGMAPIAPDQYDWLEPAGQSAARTGR